MPTDLNGRVHLMEQTLTRLAIIQEQQTRQTEKIITSVENFSKISLMVESNIKDIDNTHVAIADIRKEIKVLDNKVDKNKEYCSDLSFNRLKLAISISVAVVVTLFGYLYTDLRAEYQKVDSLRGTIISIQAKQGATNASFKR